MKLSLPAYVLLALSAGSAIAPWVIAVTAKSSIPGLVMLGCLAHARMLYIFDQWAKP